jgi:peroxiredoxin/glutaredoxin
LNVELYSKPGCHLCEQARAVLLDVQASIPFELLEVDITRDPLLQERFATEIPVVFIDGKAWFKHRLKKDELINRLERARAFSLGTLDPQKTLSRTAPVSRGTKVGFAVVAVLALAAVFATKAYGKFVLDENRAIEGLELIADDRAAPDFALSGPEGQSTTIAGYRGKLLVLNFYATWCGPCRDELPAMNALAEQMAHEKVAVLAVDVQEDWPTVQRFFAGQKPAFALALDASGKAAEAYEKKPQLQFPETFIITPAGKVVAKLEGPRDWTDPAMLRYLRGLSRS